MKIAVLRVAIAIGTISLATSAEPGSEEQLREYTKAFDPFDRLGMWPMDHRPAAAISTAITFIDVFSSKEAKNLKEPLAGEDLKSQKRHLRLIAKRIAEVMKNATAIEAQWKPELLPPEKKTRLAKMRAVITTFEFGETEEVGDEEFRQLSAGMQELAMESAFK